MTVTRLNGGIGTAPAKNPVEFKTTMAEIRLVTRTAIALIACLTAGGAVAAAQAAKASLWTDPGPIAGRNLTHGSGAADRAPKGPFTFLKQDTGGTQPKIRVRDGSGREWDVKFGEEVHAEVAANRIVWALGYVVEEVYFVASGQVTGAGDAGRAKDHIAANGAFTNARFRLRDDAAERAEERWTFARNPFAGSKELSGLAILMTLLNNWDIQGERNNRILKIAGEERYIVSDLGATFGKMGQFPAPRSKWNLEDFQKEEFIEKVEDGAVDLDYEGYGGINKVPLEHARWFAGLLSQLTDAQLRDAFAAAGASAQLTDGFTARLRAKIAELQAAVK
ncbi:MAG: hypothetical protein M3R55_03875 [Acidobacteriota bacterium]|nr:hypothetical protein [Acidobacteriota bacterium]